MDTCPVAAPTDCSNPYSPDRSVQLLLTRPVIVRGPDTLKRIKVSRPSVELPARMLTRRESCMVMLLASCPKLTSGWSSDVLPP